MTEWPEVLQQYGGIVWKTVRRLINDDADASDCFQETFVAAIEFSRKQPVQNWPGLLKRLATIRALDHLRKRFRSAAQPLIPEELAELVSSATLPPSVAEEHELFDKLRSALSAMPSDQAQACCLRYLESMSYEQIAAELGVTINHVGVLLHRAKLQIELAAFAPATFHKLETRS
jgi:RNA polymerase sigma-70 factor, ECF subfamily